MSADDRQILETCPQCGGPLAHLNKGGDHAPYKCASCLLAFWPSELEHANRLLWRPTHRDFGHGRAALAIHDARDADRAKQRER